MTEPGDGDGSRSSAAAPADDADIPPTRKHDSLEPPARESHLSIETDPTRFPDDGPVAKNVRAVDHGLGQIEQGLLFALLAIVVLVAALAALSDKLVHHQLGRWWFTVVRAGTFSIAIFGAVFATHQQRHLAMDLVSRRLTPFGRLWLGLLLKLLTIAIAVMFFRSGMHQRATVGSSGEALNLLGFHLTDKDVVTTIPIGAALIILHSLLHIVIDAEYLVRGKLPPERARSGH